MCGIAGFIGIQNDEGLLRRMAGRLAHRGPDDEGFFQNSYVALANRRLSIIDLSGGHQPISNEANDVWVVFNGEIYNFPELRDALLKKGHTFKTRSDTEVIAHLYEEHGDSFPEHLLGMFAVALWDERQKQLLLVRDHLGKKPLFYWHQGEQLVFASEAKAILECNEYQPEVDDEALHFFLNCRWVSGERTLFKGIFNVLPGQLVRFRNGTITTKRYWELRLALDTKRSERETAEQVHALLKQAVRRRQISDVPLGVFLSGGVDSTAIVAMMREIGVSSIKTFTLGFDDPTDEVEDARRISRHFGTEHHDLMVDANPLRFLPESVWYSETAKVNSIQMFLVSKLARQHVKVALSGLGGDELFGGYDNYMYVKPLQAFQRFAGPGIQRIFRGVSDVLFRMQLRSGRFELDEYRRGLQMLLSLGDRTRYYLILRNVWDGDQRFYDSIYAPDFAQHQRQWHVRSHFERYFPNDCTPMLSQVMHSELQEKIVADQIWMEDRMTMANSLESRAPFLDKDLVEYAMTIPDSLKIRGNTRKYILRKALESAVPEYVFDKKKWGFAFVPHRQFGRDLRETARRILTKERIERDAVFRYDYIKTLLDYPPHKSMQWHYLYLWNLTGYHIWRDLFITRHKSVEDLTAEISIGQASSPPMG